jgi:hypothetical protein
MRKIGRAIAATVVASLMGFGAAASASAATWPGLVCDGKIHTTTSRFVTYTYKPIKVIGGSKSGWVYEVKYWSNVTPVVNTAQVWCYK